MTWVVSQFFWQGHFSHLTLWSAFLDPSPPLWTSYVEATFPADMSLPRRRRIVLLLLLVLWPRTLRSGNFGVQLWEKGKKKGKGNWERQTDSDSDRKNDTNFGHSILHAHFPDLPPFLESRALHYLCFQRDSSEGARGLQNIAEEVSRERLR